ncbi:MAG: Rne/Rng family ribonuclease, partial [Acidobacteriota bacterium]
MSTKMLINATRGGQLRVAIVEGTILQEFQVEVTEDDQTRGNIYRGVVANIQPSLNAAFVDLGEERHGFLPAGDVLPCAYHKEPPKDVRRPNISQVLEKGKPILVQVTKDGVGQKGPALSTNLALAGRYLVLTPFDSVRGISRKAQDDAARKKIRERLKKLELPDEHGVIVRTNGLDQNQQTLNRDLNALLRLWKKVKTEANRGRGAKLVYSDQDLVMQALRDYLDASISEVVVDHDEVFAKAEAFMKAFMPRSKTQLVRYEDRLPLFSRYRLETQIDRIYERTASLPSGGGIVIDLTEALTAIDVNSGRATKTTNHDESIYKINCEAAKEVARQLRLRDIGGLVVVDFIDMRLRKHQNRLERVMRDAMKRDNARHSVGRISPNGLLEINRQRIKQSLRLRTHRPCPTCGGAGTTPTPEFAALRLLSRIEARAASGLVQSVTLALHPEIADVVQNRYRVHLSAIEVDHGVAIEILAAANLGLTEERIEWVQREGGAAAPLPVKARRAVNAADLTPTDRQDAPDEEDDAEERSEGRGRRRRRRRR